MARIKMGPGTLYGTIKRLLEARMIEESDERPDPELDDERRRYYRLTALGQRAVTGRSAALRGDGGRRAPQAADRQAGQGSAGGRSRVRRAAPSPTAKPSPSPAGCFSVCWPPTRRRTAANTARPWRNSSATSAAMPGARGRALGADLALAAGLAGFGENVGVGTHLNS